MKISNLIVATIIAHTAIAQYSYGSHLDLEEQKTKSVSKTIKSKKNENLNNANPASQEYQRACKLYLEGDFQKSIHTYAKAISLESVDAVNQLDFILDLNLLNNQPIIWPNSIKNHPKLSHHFLSNCKRKSAFVSYKAPARKKRIVKTKSPQENAPEILPQLPEFLEPLNLNSHSKKYDETILNKIAKL